MAAAMGGLLLVYAGWQLLQWPSGDRTLIGDAFFYPVGVAAIGAAVAASRRCADQPRLRSAWRLLALASASYLAGDIAQTVYELAGSKPYPSLADGFYLAFYPLTLWGLLRFPASRRDLGERVRLSLDLAVVAIGGSAVVMYVVLGPAVIQGGPDPLWTAISIAYPVGDMVLLVGLASVLLRRSGASTARALQFVAGGLVLFVAADLVYGYITLHSTYQGGDPVDSLWMVAIALFAVAGAAQASSEPTADVATGNDLASASWPPYIAVAVGFGLLIFSERHAPLLPDLSLVIAAVVLATLVSVRQFLAQRDVLHTQGRLSHQSMHDALTGLPNRALVIDRAEQMLVRARRVETPVAALYVDVDGFKHINDSFGHAAGDELLRVVAERLGQIVRGSDTVGRLGGDEFVVLLQDLTFDAGPELVAERICEVLRQPMDLYGDDERSVTVTASIGVALGQRDSADELLRDADFALYEAKGAGKDRFVVFESSMQTVAQDRLELEMDLRQALETDQFFLLYQPTFDLQSETITGFEALIRWRHPIRGIVPPDAFIALAEQTGVIVPIGRWVLERACERAALWSSQGHELGMSINVSARQLDQPEFVRDVADILAATEIDPATLTLEITETVLMRDPDVAGPTLAALKAVGVRIAIDDFGTGYSSLAYLRQFPVDALKIDRSFIAAIADSSASKALIHTLVQLGKALGLETVGEGIEERAQLRHLQRELCDSGQGFLFARPLDVDAVEELLAHGPQRIAS
ncbi:MAG: EAL domain-containing protein [Actinomycetota bacterium]|nr:EAL domain-containing protein [Actinomycetota bacterium]